MYRMVFMIGALAHLLTWIVAAAYNKTPVFFPIYGSVNLDGYYSVKLNIGNPSAEYNLRIDSRSDLTWVRCGTDDKKKNHAHLIPNLTAPCMHQTCVSLQAGEIPNCGTRDQLCRYEVSYAISSKSTGLLYFDVLDLNFTDVEMRKPTLAIGCDQRPTKGAPHDVDGIMGIGKGNAGILHQLNSFGGMIDNIFGHCFSEESGGFITFGGIPKTDIVWLPSLNSADYKNGSDLYIGNQTDPISQAIQLHFDSGSPYSYFSYNVYTDLLTYIEADLGNQLNRTNDTTSGSQLPVCWNVTAFQSNETDAYAHFKSLNFIVADDKASYFSMDPSSYLIRSSKNRLCLGILDGGSVNMGMEQVVIGEFGMLNKWIVYDNNEDNSRVGWAAANCTKTPVF